MDFLAPSTFHVNLAFVEYVKVLLELILDGLLLNIKLLLSLLNYDHALLYLFYLIHSLLLLHLLNLLSHKAYKGLLTLTGTSLHIGQSLLWQIRFQRLDCLFHFRLFLRLEIIG